MMNKTKLIRITTVPVSLKTLLKGQHRFMSENEYEVIGVSSHGQELQDVENEEDIRTITLEMTRTISPLKDLKSLWNFYQLCKKEKPKIVHSHTPKAGIVGMLGAKLAGVPVRLHTVAGLPLMETTGTKRKILDFVEKLTYSCATKVYPNSKGLYDFIVENKYTSTEKLKVIGQGSSNGIDTNHFNPNQIADEQKENIKNQLGIKKEDFVFIFVGRLVGDKGINELVEAFLKLHVSSKGVENSKIPVSSSEAENCKIDVSSSGVENSKIHVSSRGSENSKKTVSSSGAENCKISVSSSGSENCKINVSSSGVENSKIHVSSSGVENCKLLLVGSLETDLDPLKEETLREIKTNPNIISVGFQNDVRPYFSISDCLVFPSYREGFPNVVMQAGAMGLPSIVSNINGCNEIIVEGTNGTIIPVKNSEALKISMQKMIADKQYYQALKQNARPIIQSRYEQSVVWNALLEEYNSLIVKIKEV